MLRNLILCLFLLAFETASSQNPVLSWVKSIGSSYGIENGRSIAVDAQGNVYSIGLFFNTVDFDPGPGDFSMTAGGPFGMAIYIWKLNTNGDFMWAKQLPLSIEGPMHMAIDRFSNVYITSQLRNTADMDPGAGVHTIGPSAGFADAFVLKLNTNGDFVWVKQFSGMVTDTGPTGSAISVDPDDNIIVSGSFNNKVDFDPGPATFAMTAIGPSEALIVKLKSDGGFVWARKLGNYTDPYGQIYIQDSKCDRFGNIYTAGYFQGTCDFDPGSASFPYTSGGPSDGFISKLDRNGNFVWARKIGNSASNFVVMPFGIDIDSHDNVYTTGAFIGNQDFDPGAGVYTLNGSGAMDGFILKLTGAGNFVWARKIGGSGQDALYDIVLDNADNLYITGFFGSSFDFDPGPGVVNMNFYDDAVISKFDEDGNFIYVAPFLGGQSGGRRLETDPDRNVYLTGYFGAEVDFDPGPGEYKIPYVANTYDAFVLKLSKCPNETFETINETVCDKYILNGVTFDSTGQYKQRLRNSTGCDSTITLNLVVNKKYTEQTKVICEGDSIVIGGAYRKTAGKYKDTLVTHLGCDSIVTTLLSVNARPTPDLGKDRPFCLNSSATITPGNFEQYVWQDLSTEKNFTVRSEGTYWVTVTNGDQCSASDTLVIKGVAQSPAIFLHATDTICYGIDFILQPLQSFDNYEWSTGSNERNIIIRDAGNYWLKIRDKNGCVGIDTVAIAAIDCKPGVYVPTAFSPNGDGKNDVFMVAARAELENFKLQVFDRWGRLVFQTTNPKQGWDGANGGIAQSTNTFVWVCSYKPKNDIQRVQKGTVVLVR